MNPSRYALCAALLPLTTGIVASAASAQFVVNTEFGFGMDDAEITPDGRYAVVRENSGNTITRIYDLATGQVAASFMCPTFVFENAVQDAVVVTDDRAIVLGACTPIFDLTNPGSTIAVLDTGADSRDVAIAPDGRRLAIRGGKPGGGSSGGLFIVDPRNGSVLATAPGLPSDPFGVQQPFDVDSVVISDNYAAFVSLEDTASGPRTRVTIFDLYTPPSGLPTIVFETTSAGVDQDQLGAPHDIAITPDGLHVAVRSELSVGLYELNGPQSRRLWHKRLFGEPGPFGNWAMDSVEVTDEWIATISRDANGGFAAQVDLFDIQGNQRFDDIPGDPHDLQITPDGERLLVRTSSGIFLYDLTNVPAGLQVPAVASQPLLTTHTSFGAGMDSLVVTNDTAVTLSRDGDFTDVDIWDIGATSIARRSGGVMNGRPLDLEISPNERLLGVAGLVHAQVYDLATGDLLLDHVPAPGLGYWPWCDGIAMNDDSMVAFGYTGTQSGWVSLIDLFSSQVPYCTASPNSVGPGATIYSTGSPSVGSNDLEVIVRDLPANVAAQFVYGAAQINTPFGDGVLCVGGQAFRFPYGRSDADGIARRAVDNTAAPRLGGAVMVGTTWNFQLIYRDPAGPGGTGGTGFNTSDGVQIAFGS